MKMLQFTCRLLNLVEKSSHFNLRAISKQAPRWGAKTYEGEGKTSIQILNDEADLGLMINGFSQYSWTFRSDESVLYYYVYFEILRSVLSWNVKDAYEINEETLSLFTILEPKLDILVLGLGDTLEDFSIYQKLLPLGRKLKLCMEILSTEQACATFNFLNSESRVVAGAMIPPVTIKATDDDILSSKLRYQNLYETDDPKLL